MANRCKPKLQLAIDVTNTADARSLVEAVYPFFDIAEIGTPLIIEEGLAPLEILKVKYPDKKYLADTKIVDAGYIEASSAFKRGADIVTVLGVADDKTVHGVLEAACAYHGKVMADLMHVTNRIERAKALESLGIHTICLHTAYDVQQIGVDPMADLTEIRAAVACPLAIAGGITLDDVERAVTLGADILVVGGGIVKQCNPRQAARQIIEKIEVIS